jgi:hypothetical protein
MELGTVKKHGLDAQKTHDVNPFKKKIHASRSMTVGVYLPIDVHARGHSNVSPLAAAGAGA